MKRQIPYVLMFIGFMIAIFSIVLLKDDAAATLQGFGYGLVFASAIAIIVNYFKGRREAGGSRAQR